MVWVKKPYLLTVASMRYMLYLLYLSSDFDDMYLHIYMIYMESEISSYTFEGCAAAKIWCNFLNISNGIHRTTFCSVIGESAIALYQIFHSQHLTICNQNLYWLALICFKMMISFPKLSQGLCPQNFYFYQYNDATLILKKFRLRQAIHSHRYFTEVEGLIKIVLISIST